ncbi:MAG: cellulase family glycosylhydrolase [Armatimonadota bacterium]
MSKAVLKIVLSICLAAIATAAHPSASGLPEQTVPQPFGVNIHFSGQNDAAIAQLSEAGFKIIRMDMTWSKIEKAKGVYDFEAYDGLMSSLDNKGIRPLFILDYTNALYDGGEPPTTPAGRAAFAAFAGAAAQHFKDRGIIWEIWNEPNIKTFWKPGPDPENYTELAESAYKAIKAADPQTTVAGPAASSIDIPFIEKCFAYGLLNSIDAVSVHPYRQTAPETVIPEYQQLKDLIKRYAPKGKEIPIISSEWGYNTLDKTEAGQAQFAARMFLVNMMSDVKLSIWYDWQDDGLDPANREHHFGLVYNNLKPKPAYNAVKTLTHELDQCKLASRLGSRNDDYILLFKGPSGYRIAAWTAGEEHNATLPIDNPKVRMVTIDGTASDISPEGGKLAFKISQSPVYIEAGQNDRLALEEAITLKTSRERLKDVVMAEISNPLSRQINGSLTMAISGAKTMKEEFSLGAGKSRTFKFSPETAWDGLSDMTAEAAIAVDGLNEPITRSIDLGTEHRITAYPSCPLSRVLEFRIVSPLMEKMKGKLRLFDVSGIKPRNLTTDFDVESQTVVGFTLEDPAPKKFSFGYELADVTGRVILRSPVLNYEVIEDFSSINAGQQLSGYKVSLASGTDKAGTVFADGYMIDTPYASLSEIPSCRLRYDLKGTESFTLAPDKEISMAVKPVAIGMWIRGDGTGGIARSQFVDSNGRIFQTEGFKIDWTGWRYKSMLLGGNTQAPSKLDSIFLLDTGGTAAKGTIYIGPVMVVSLPDQPGTSKL